MKVITPKRLYCKNCKRFHCLTVIDSNIVCTECGKTVLTVKEWVNKVKNSSILQEKYLMTY